jgi:PAS domain S-box-containing protein
MITSPVREKHLVTEAEYSPEDLFFSVTDLQSHILYGNDAFFNIAEYSREELVGKPHNTIRNPATPRAVFKLLWEYLKAAKGVGAYVVNRTKTGKYYWVYGIFSPVLDENTGQPIAFISVRLKPQSDRLAVIENLYSHLLAVEADHGMDTAYDKLLHSITELGFEDYDAFVNDSLNLESSVYVEQDFFSNLLNRSKVKKTGNNDLFVNLQALRKGVRLLDEGIKGLVDVKSSLYEIRELLEGTKHFFSNVRDASLNLAISAGNLQGNASRVLNPIVSQLIEMSESGEGMMEQFEKMANSLISNHKTLTYDANKVMFYSSAYHNDLLDKVSILKVSSQADQGCFSEKSENENMVEEAISNVTLNDLMRLEAFVKDYVVEIQNLSDLVTRKLGYMLILGRGLTTQGSVLAEDWNATGVINNLNALQHDIMTIETKLDATASNFSSVLNTMNILNEATKINVNTYEAFSTTI